MHCQWLVHPDREDIGPCITQLGPGALVAGSKSSRTLNARFAPVSSSLAYLALDRDESSTVKNLYRTANLGRSLTSAATLPCNLVNDLVCTDPTHGFAACDERNSFASTILLTTSDGGVSWRRAASLDPSTSHPRGPGSIAN